MKAFQGLRNGIKILATFLLVAAGVLFIRDFGVCPAYASPAHEYIADFKSEISIQYDSSLNVTEEITVNIMHQSIRHGITRAFPVEYKDKHGNDVTVGFDIQEIMMDGESIPYNVTKQGRYFVIRIGSKDRLAPTGLHKYLIRYNTTRQIGFFEKHDELYWNVTGNGWEFPIHHVSCSVSLPGQQPGRNFNSIEWYTGAYGEKGQAAKKTADGQAVETTGILQKGEGLTVVYTWVKGLVTPPPPVKDMSLIRSIIALMTFMSIFLWLAFVWYQWGVDPPRNPYPLFRPPQGMSAAYMRYVRELETDSTMFAVAIISLAIKGAVLINEYEPEGLFAGKRKRYVLTNQVESAKEPLTHEEIMLINALFSKHTITSIFKSFLNRNGESEPVQLESSLEISKKNGSILKEAVKSLDDKYKETKSELFSSNIMPASVTIIIYAVGVVAMYFTGITLPEVVLYAWGGIVTYIIWLSTTLRGHPADTFKQIALQLLVIVVPLYFILKLYLSLHLSSSIQYYSIIMLAAALQIIAANPFISARTEKGALLLEQTEGLKMYMETAEEERLNMFADEPEDTPEIFEKMLPYALALDCAKTWCNRFASMMERIQYQPKWYSGSNAYMFAMAGGIDSITTMAEGLNKSISGSLPRNAPGGASGAGGGGFSGGGGGGGGGGGW